MVENNKGLFQIHRFAYVILIVREPNSETCLALVMAAPLCEKVIIVSDINWAHITSAIKKFMMDRPSPGSFQNIGLLI